MPITPNTENFKGICYCKLSKDNTSMNIILELHINASQIEQVGKILNIPQDKMKIIEVTTFLTGNKKE